MLLEKRKYSPGPGPLDVNEILVAEFEYIAKTAFQANEDRARVSNYYLMTAGAAVAAILGAKIEGEMQPVGASAQRLEVERAGDESDKRLLPLL